jgi:hypothetical protein
VDGGGHAGGPWLGADSLSQFDVARHPLPAIYAYRSFVGEGGLMTYGVRAASYIDRIFRGEKPTELPVQQPTKFEFVVNLKRRTCSASSCPISYSSAPTR